MTLQYLVRATTTALAAVKTVVDAITVPTTAQIRTAVEAAGSSLATLLSRLTGDRASNLDNLNDTITSRASLNRLNVAITAIGTLNTLTTLAIKTVADKFNFNGNDDVKSTLDGESVTTDAASRTASRSTGFATPADITSAKEEIETAITNKPVTPVTDLSGVNTKLDANKTAIDGVKDSSRRKCSQINYGIIPNCKYGNSSGFTTCHIK